MLKIVCVFVIISFSLSAQNFSNNSYSLDKNYAEKIERLNTQIKNDSSGVDFYFELAGVYFSLNKFQPAAELLRKAAIIDKKNPDLYSQLGTAYLALEQYFEAKAAFETSLELDSSNIGVMLKTGKVYYALKEWRKGRALFKKLIKMDDSTANYYEQLAKFEEVLKEYDNAIVHYQIANNLNSKNINTIIRLSSLYFKTERIISALRVADASLKYYPAHADVWRIKAEAHFKLEEFNEAAQAYKTALGLGDTSVIVYRNIGICLFTLDSLDDGIAYLDTAFAKDKKDIVTVLYLGASYKDKGDIENALKYLLMVEDVWTNRYVIESYIQLAALYQQRKDYVKSIDYYNKAIQKDPEKISLKFRLAAVYDEYYSDKQKALNLFLEYAADSAAADPVMLNYARKRIDEIKEKIFFSK